MEQLKEELSSRSQLLELAILEVITEQRFESMSVAEVLGTLEFVKRALFDELE